ncbi:MAG: prohibitin family protein [Candidatus Woesearchaeota archaeon]|nr:prohibitin family protein [Candidatus Woesearchaeota archaeon]
MDTEETNVVKYVLWAVGAIVALFIVISLLPFTIVKAGERAVVLRLGKVDRVLPEGIHWVTPWIEDIETMDIRTQKEEVTANSASKDLQTVTTKVALNYNLQAESVGKLWSEIGKDYKNRVIDPSIQEAVKAATAKYTAEELITKRELVRDAMKNALVERLSKDNITVSEVSIVDFDFSAGFNQSIEAKVKAEQDALTAKNKLEQIKFEAEQKIATAEAEARSIRLQSDAANNEKYVSLKQLEVQLEAAKKWDGHGCVNNCYGSTVTPPIPFLQLGGK